jgi:hypothetical protein
MGIYECSIVERAFEFPKALERNEDTKDHGPEDHEKSIIRP